MLTRSPRKEETCVYYCSKDCTMKHSLVLMINFSEEHYRYKHHNTVGELPETSSKTVLTNPDF